MKNSTLTVNTTTEMKTPVAPPDDDEESADIFFEENFLNEYYSIRDKVHDLLKRFVSINLYRVSCL